MNPAALIRASITLAGIASAAVGASMGSHLVRPGIIGSVPTALLAGSLALVVLPPLALAALRVDIAAARRRARLAKAHASLSQTLHDSQFWAQGLTPDHPRPPAPSRRHAASRAKPQASPKAQSIPQTAPAPTAQASTKTVS